MTNRHKKTISLIALVTAVITILYFTIAPITIIFRAPSRSQRQIVTTPNFQLPLATSTFNLPTTTPPMEFQGPTSSPKIKGPIEPPPRSGR